MNVTGSSGRFFPIPEVLAIALLLWALVPTNPYGYYIILRFVTCGVSMFLALRARVAGKTVWLWTFVAVAVVYNPIIRVHLTRESWSAINLATVAMIAASIFLLKPSRREKV